MPYLGNVPAEAYTNTVKDSFNGDASTTAFTLSQPSTTNNLRVVVENVIQDPTVAYSCSGTTLTFTSAPPSGTANIYAVHLGPAVMTAVPPTEITNATNFTDGITVDKDGAAVITADRASSDGTIIDLQKDGSSVGSIGSLNSARDLHVNSTGGILTLESNFSSTERIILFGNTYFGPRSTDNNAVDLGRSVSQFKNLYLSGGVYLGGTGSANYLDDYERGTFTPALSATGWTFSYSVQQGTYIKVGDLVTCSIYVRSSSTSGSGVTQLRITNLPFTINNTNNSSYTGAPIVVEGSGSTFSGIPMFRLNKGTTQGVIFDVIAGSSPSINVAINQITSSTEFELQVTYIAD